MKKLSGIIAMILLFATSCEKQGLVAQWDIPLEFPVWRGEKVGAQVSVSSALPIKSLSVRLSSIALEGDADKVIPEASASYITLVKGDVFKPGFNQCGVRRPGQLDSIMVADRISGETVAKLRAGKKQKVWLSIKVPQDAKPGIYRGSLVFKSRLADDFEVPFTLKVQDHVLPSPQEWKFHLDLWQNPYAAARVYNTPLWSPEHFEAMRPVMKMLADAGQKVITATIMNRPWNGQTEDPFGSMVTKTLKPDGTWEYNYEVFDRWVEFMMSLGIDKQIDCYSMIPWNLSFDYFDQEYHFMRTISAELVQSPEFVWYWSSFIKDFAKHLRQKGWFDITHIAMDERNEDDMSFAISLIHSVEPDFKIALAGRFHENIQADIDDLCVASTEYFPIDVKARRAKNGQTSTFYVCCAERYPNTFLASNPDEASWLSYFAAKEGYDGFLRWAYNSWTANPDKDARFNKWAAGDCYMVYPGCSSVRFEKLIEGIEGYEKLRILSENGTPDYEINAILSRFNFKSLSEEGATPAVRAIRTAISKR